MSTTLQIYNSSYPLSDWSSVRKKKVQTCLYGKTYIGTLIGKYYLPLFTGSLD
jgi:hypothetical protein